MELAIYKFDHDNRLDDLTTIEIGGEIWFVAADVCAMLDIKNITDTVSGLEEDERMGLSKKPFSLYTLCGKIYDI